jgi:two-component system response regulator AtoC
VPIYLPPLRDRPEDILPLAHYFLEKMCMENHKQAKTFSKESIKKLVGYAWPGNVRELANIVERAVVMTTNSEITPEHLYIENNHPNLPLRTASTLSQNTLTSLPVGMTLQELEKRLIIETLQAQHNNRTKTAEVLGISVRTLRNKLNEYNMKNER